MKLVSAVPPTLLPGNQIGYIYMGLWWSPSLHLCLSLTINISTFPLKSAPFWMMYYMTTPHIVYTFTRTILTPKNSHYFKVSLKLLRFFSSELVIHCRSQSESYKTISRYHCNKLLIKWLLVKWRLIFLISTFMWASTKIVMY